MKKRIIIFCVVTAVLIAGLVTGFRVLNKNGQTRSNSVEAKIRETVNIENLTYVKSEDGLDEYVDEQGSFYYYKGTKIRLFMSNNYDYSGEIFTRDEIIKLAEQKLAECVTYDPSDGFVTDYVYDDYSVSYTLYKSNGNIKLQIVTIVYDYYGNLMTINYFLDRADENLDEIQLNSSDAIGIAQDYVKNNFDELNNQFSTESELDYMLFLDSDSLRIEADIKDDVCNVTFESDDGYVKGCIVGVSLKDGKITYCDRVL